MRGLQEILFLVYTNIQIISFLCAPLRSLITYSAHFPQHNKYMPESESLTVATQNGTATSLPNLPGLEIPESSNGQSHWLTAEDLDYFKGLLLENRGDAMYNIDRIREGIEDAREQAENDTAYSLHMADSGTDAMEREKAYMMLARQQKYVGYLDRALERIEKGTYGICKATGNPISRGRLEAVPHTELSMPAKQKQPDTKNGKKPSGNGKRYYPETNTHTLR